ncbi:MAG: hypothetical protein K6A68_14480 [Clostridiales bacterium]|nr:hypothetical protein [Clostridiales bacterium]
MMKRFHLWAAVLLFSLCVAACAGAAEIRPLDTDHLDVDLTNGFFCFGVKDADRIVDGGWFTASLYLEDHYDAKQIESMAPGDTVLVSGELWTVREVILHEADESGLIASYEIYTEEENDNYIVFIPETDGCCICQTDDWVPVSPVADIRITLPLPDGFVYRSGEEEVLRNADAFLNDLEAYGDLFVPYNSFCVIRDGSLISVTHSAYPEGPDIIPDEDVEAEEPEAADDTGAMPVWRFCHGLREGLETAVIKGYTNDCEEGPAEYAMTPGETGEIRALAINGIITGKASDLSVTRGTWTYTFESQDGERLLSIEMYKGWIVGPDGMYTYEE